MDLIAQPGQPARIDARPTAYVQDDGGRTGQMTRQDLLRPRELQPEVRRQSVGFVVLLVEGSDLIGEGEGIGHSLRNRSIPPPAVSTRSALAGLRWASCGWDRRR